MVFAEMVDFLWFQECQVSFEVALQLLHQAQQQILQSQQQLVHLSQRPHKVPAALSPAQRLLAFSKTPPTVQSFISAPTAIRTRCHVEVASSGMTKSKAATGPAMLSAEN